MAVGLIGHDDGGTRAAPVLVVNCGSSSVTLDLVDDAGDGHPLLRLDRPLDEAGARGEVEDAAVRAGPLAAVAHRIVSGGARTAPAVIDDDVLSDLRRVASDDAPIHGPLGILGIAVVGEARPDVPAVACFDTEFHRGLALEARTLPLPASWRAVAGERRGFHGPGHEWASRRAAQILDRRPEDLHLVSAHLGGGASAAAIHGGRSVDVTMGSTPLEGMVMGTRSGSLDPAVVLASPEGTGGREVLERESGLAGLSGRSSDLRELYPAADDGDGDARLAVDVYARSVAQGIAAMATSLPRLDAVVLTGGAGSGSARLRADVSDRLGVLGVRLDAGANEEVGDGEGRLHGPDSPVALLSVVAREELVIAEAARRALPGGRPAGP